MPEVVLDVRINMQQTTSADNIFRCILVLSAENLNANSLNPDQVNKMSGLYESKLFDIDGI